MGRAQVMVDEAIAVAKDDEHGYSQYRRWPWQGSDFDCSSLTYWCANRAGYDVPLAGYTGTILNDFIAAGFIAYPYDGNVYDCPPGTVLLAHNEDRQHVEIYIGDGKNVGAHIAETGDIDGAPGDQTGNEISVAQNWGWWDWALVPPVDDEPPAPVPAQVPGDPVNNAGFVYQGHIQNLGWEDPVRDGQVAGTVGFGLRLEALRIDPPEGYKLRIRVHEQNIGNVVYDNVTHGNGIVIGTTGQALRLEALGIEVIERPPGDNRELQYRLHQQNTGWKAWTKEGFTSGSDGLALQLEAIQIKLV